MYSRCLSRLLLLVLFAASSVAAQAPKTLRVCADPDNLPYSHEDGSGFENRIAQLLARELNAQLQYDWLPQRRGYVRKTMGANLCDVFIGVPAQFERVTTTRPYYRSGYTFVYRLGTAPYESFDDPRLKRVRVGVQLVGDDLDATPPGYALARHGAVDNVRGYTVFGDGPAAQRMIDALASGELDVALLWGPQAGYFIKHAAVPLQSSWAQTPADLTFMPFEFDIAMGVRRGDKVLREALNRVIETHGAQIDAILDEYSVPRRGIANVATAP